MKANEAPEKLYMNWVNYPLEEMQVEYTCTDACIEKARKWFENDMNGLILMVLVTMTRVLLRTLKTI